MEMPHFCIYMNLLANYDPSSHNSFGKNTCRQWRLLFEYGALLYIHTYIEYMYFTSCEISGWVKAPLSEALL